jgi:hypothetical protein
MYTLTNGSRKKSAKTLSEAMELAQKWSLRSGQVISVVRGSHTHTYIYKGREITGMEANRIWMDEEVYDYVDTTYEPLVM